MYTVSSRSALRIRDTRQPGPTNAASQVARNADEAGLRVAALLGLQRGSVFGRGSPARTKADPKIWTASRDCSVHVKRKRSPAIHTEYMPRSVLSRLWLRDHLGHVSQQKIFSICATHRLAWKCTQPHRQSHNTIDSADRPPILDRSRQLGPNQMETARCDVTSGRRQLFREGCRPLVVRFATAYDNVDV